MNSRIFVLCFLILFNFGKCDESTSFEEILSSEEHLNLFERSKLLNIFSVENYPSLLLESLSFDGISEECRNQSQAVAHRLKDPSAGLTNGYWHLKSKSFSRLHLDFYYQITIMYFK